jgi:hypothetical protein
MSIGKLQRIALTAMIIGGIACGPAFAQAPDPAGKAAQDSARALGLQTDLPRLKRPEPIPIHLPVEVVWAALICGAALLLYLMRHQLVFRRGRAGDGWGESGSDTDPEGAPGARDPLATADQLSRDGRFVEAMHMLLLQSLAEIRQRLGIQFADSLTSREILRGTRLSPQSRASLREIVGAVEWTYFGGYPAAFADYAACRRSFENLRQTLAGGSAA